MGKAVKRRSLEEVVISKYTAAQKVAEVANEHLYNYFLSQYSDRIDKATTVEEFRMIVKSLTGRCPDSVARLDLISYIKSVMKEKNLLI